MHVQSLFESVNPDKNTNVYDEEIKENILYLISWNKYLVYLLSFTNEFIINLLPHFMKDLCNQFLVFASRQSPKIYTLYSIDLIMGSWEIDGIWKQDALNKQMSICQLVQKVWRIPGPGLYLMSDRIRCDGNIIYSYWLGSRTTAVLFVWGQIRSRVKLNCCCQRSQSITVMIYTFI